MLKTQVSNPYYKTIFKITISVLTLANDLWNGYTLIWLILNILGLLKLSYLFLDFLKFNETNFKRSAYIMNTMNQ
jgi:hypothetical protein